MSDPALSGLQVLVTRPAGRNDSLIAELEARGGAAIVFPAMEISGRDPALIRADLPERRTDEPPLFIFVSTPAVVHGLQSVTEIFGEPGILSVAAVGSATAGQLAEAGCRNIRAPVEGSGSEALLEALGDMPVSGRDVIILRGPSGREKLAETLSERGARVSQVTVYERRKPQARSDELESLIAKGGIHVVTATSVEIYRNLLEMIPESARERLRNMPLLVPSGRVVKMVRDLGARGPIIEASGAGDKAMVAALQAWRRSAPDLGREEGHDMSEDKPAEKPATEPGQPESGSGQTAEGGQSAAEPTAEQVSVQSGTDAPTVVEVRKSSGGTGILALIVALAAAAGSAWLWWQMQQQAQPDIAQAVSRAEAQLGADIDTLRRELDARDDQLADVISDQQGLILRLDTAEALDMRLQGIENELQAMRGVSSNARRDWVMAEAAYFLQAANATLQLNRNVDAALQALEAADDRLASLAEPFLLPVRSEIAKEKQLLGAVPRIDPAGMALTLGELARRAGDLETRTDNPEVYATPGTPDAEGESAGLDRARKVLGDALKSMVTVRRTDQQASALLAPEEEFFLARNLELQLLTARLALLNEQPDVFRQSIETSIQWLNTFFDTRSAGVAEALRTLESFRESPIRRALPDISGSLGLLRDAQLRSRAQ